MKIQSFFNQVCTLSILAIFLAGCGKSAQEEPEINRSREIISAHKAVFEQHPEHVPSFKIVDGPITGNGDIGLTMSGKPEKQRFWISKNDFWKSGPHFKQCGPSLIGGIDIEIPSIKGASYHVEQILYEAVLQSEFSTRENTVHMEARVPATDNLILIELKVTDKPVEVNLDLWAKKGYGSTTEKGSEETAFWVTRKFNGENLLYPTEASIAMSCIDDKARSFTLTPDQPVTIVASVVTNHEASSYKTNAIRKAQETDKKKINRLKYGHEQWWQKFWSKSFVDLEDQLLEKYYYASHYIMACCSRNEDFPPGLYGNWITMNRTAWAGDYHLNYNYEAPYWGLYSSNRIELTDPYDTPLMEHLDVFKNNARKHLNIEGAYASVGIGPKKLTPRFFDQVGMDYIYGEKFGSDSYEPLTGQPMFLGQKSNAIFASMNMILRYRYTYDEKYIRKFYPYLSAVAAFWENYLVFENGRYVIYNDSFHEVGPWQGKGWQEGYGDFNPSNSLGFLRIFFEAMIEISQDIGIDQNKTGKWKHILTHLSDFPVYSKNGKKQFRAVEGGDGSSSDLVGLKWLMVHGLIFPATNFGLSSDPEELKMIHEGMDRWDAGPWLKSGNSIQSVLIGGARVGYDPDTLFAIAKKKINQYAYPNLWIFAAGGGIETCSAIPGMINEMMLQSHKNIIRIFPGFPEDQEASFYRLRTFGAFLVSSAVDNGEVQYAVAESEKGKTCNILNPWPGKTVRVYRDGKESKVPPERILKFETQPGEKFILAPEGINFEEIKATGRII